jgi:outer membrane lipoprotein SlyB
MRPMPMIAAAMLAAACSSHPDPIVDTKGVNMAAYERDLAECKQYGGQIQPVQGVAKGTAAGAAVGAAIGAIHHDAGEGAAVGAVSGGASSAVRADEDRQDVVKRCMRGRGYKVLN